jgi:hypothetical protein
MVMEPFSVQFDYIKLLGLEKAAVYTRTIHF